MQVLRAGSTISDLSFRLLAGDGEPIDLVSEMFTPSSYVSESWNPHRKKQRGSKVIAYPPSLLSVSSSLLCRVFETLRR